jgi:hypothetical protein
MGVSELVDAINGFTESSAELKEDERVQLLSACKRLKNAMESPREKLLKIFYGVRVPRLPYQRLRDTNDFITAASRGSTSIGHRYGAFRCRR